MEEIILKTQMMFQSAIEMQAPAEDIAYFAKKLVRYFVRYGMRAEVRQLEELYIKKDIR